MSTDKLHSSKMTMRLYLNHPPDTRTELVVEVVADVDVALPALRAHLARLGCSTALLIDGTRALLVRDTFASLDAASFGVDAEIPTDRLLARMPANPNLDARVKHWLRSMSADWNAALPAQPADAAHFIPDVVPAVVGSSMRQVA